MAENREETNVLIAEFMGFQYGDTYAGKRWTSAEHSYPYATSALAFNSSWNWLMPVVEKIKELSISEFPKKKPVMNALLDVDITVLHKAVVEFIEWYNTQELTA